jgi:hypothetical protein
MRLTDKIVKALPVPERGNKITYDDEPKGFGCRVTAAGGARVHLELSAQG